MKKNLLLFVSSFLLTVVLFTTGYSKSERQPEFFATTNAQAQFQFNFPVAVFCTNCNCTYATLCLGVGNGCTFVGCPKPEIDPE